MSTSTRYRFFVKSLLIVSLLIGALQPITNKVIAASAPAKERWFEVEVILFSQLGDKSKLKEIFPDDTPSVTAELYNKKSNATKRRKQVFELLMPFLKPNTRTLKLQLPVCGESPVKRTYVEQAATPKPFYQSKSLKAIEELIIDEPTIANLSENTHNAIIDNEISHNTSNAAQEYEREQEQQLNQTVVQQITDENNTNTLISTLEESSEEPYEPLTAETIALVTEAEQVFNPFQFNLTQNYLPYNTGQKSKKKNVQLCRLSNEFLAQLQEYDPTFDEDDFHINTMPSTIDAAENMYSKRPYLLSKNSLKLNDIVKQLNWSKTFKPLLHIGWRLAPEGRNKAIPLHIFAGDNLAMDYQKQLAQYNSAIAAAQEATQKQAQENSEYQQETNLNALSSSSLLLSPSPVNETTLYQQEMNARLTNIFTQLRNFNKNTDEIIDEIDDKKMILKVNNQITQLENSLKIKKPNKPLQPWFLEGLFKVHLNHYLFINANFTMINKTLAEQASDGIKLESSLNTKDVITPLKLIEFKQNRRVISKEIHYFDNPYLGMIVQIRRHKRPEIPTSEVDKAM